MADRKGYGWIWMAMGFSDIPKLEANTNTGFEPNIRMKPAPSLRIHVKSHCKSTTHLVTATSMPSCLQGRLKLLDKGFDLWELQNQLATLQAKADVLALDWKCSESGFRYMQHHSTKR